MLESLFNEVWELKACNFIKKRLQHRCLPVNIAKFIRTPFCREHLRWLLLKGIENQSVKGVLPILHQIKKLHLKITGHVYSFIESAEISEVVAQRCSVKKFLWEISQKSQENTCARVSFLTKLQASTIKQTLAQVFFCEFCKSSRSTSCYRTPSVDASEIYLWTLTQTYKKCIFFYDMNVHQNS